MKVVHGVFHRFWLPNNTGIFQEKTIVAQSDIGPILSNSRAAHDVLDKIKLDIKYYPYQAKQQLRRVF